MTRSAIAVLTLKSKKLMTARVSLARDSKGKQSWTKLSGTLDLGSSGGLWKMAAFDGPNTRLMTLFDGESDALTDIVVVFVKMPPNFIDLFCKGISGDAHKMNVTPQESELAFTMDINSCS